MPLAKLDHCVIHVSDWEVSNPFYREVLGAELIDRGHGTWAYRFGSEQLNVHGPGVTADPVARIPVATGNSDLCFEWHGRIEDAIEHLACCGVEVELGPVKRHGAAGRGSSIYFRDPDGSLLEFISYRGQNPASPKGRVHTTRPAGRAKQVHRACPDDFRRVVKAGFWRFDGRLPAVRRLF